MSSSHSKGDCSKPVTCRYCKKEGHSAVECPEAPTLKCSNCKEEGHRASGCKNKHKFDWEQLPDVTGDEAWDRLKLADASKDMDDIREVNDSPKLSSQLDIDPTSSVVANLREGCRRC